GLSGPAALRLSSFVKGGEIAHLDFLPNQCQENLKTYFEENREKSVKNTLKGLVPERVAEFLAEDKAVTKINQLPPTDLTILLSHINGSEIQIPGQRPFPNTFGAKAVVTSNGFNTKTLEGTKALNSNLN
ncbi:NAD(P)/FAD-dependent oxidoreductase, partial [Klebsiella pneumoniae subsp. pneumoniae]|nr:NAD(P)/FAD-dependent oxidoreductase [Klebsiella pneumoniae subsp. pneumoniae]